MTEPSDPGDAIEELGPLEVPEFGLPKRRPFDPAKTQEWVRSCLALGSGLLLILSFMVIAIPVVVGWRSWDEVEGLSTALLPAVLSVTGSVIGFYFGADKAKKQ